MHPAVQAGQLPVLPARCCESSAAARSSYARLALQPPQAIRLGSQVAPGQRGRFWDFVRQRDDGVLLALLRDSATRRTLLAGCTHLFWNPRYPDVKVGCCC